MRTFNQFISESNKIPIEDYLENISDIFQDDNINTTPKKTLKYFKVLKEEFNEKAWLEDNYEEIIKEFCDELQDEDFIVNITPHETEEEGEDVVDEDYEYDFEIKIDIGDQIYYEQSEDFNKTIKEFNRKSLCMKLISELLLRINSDGTFIIDEVSETDIDTILIKLKIKR